jgi:hypothetical protein
LGRILLPSVADLHYAASVAAYCNDARYSANAAGAAVLAPIKHAELFADSVGEITISGGVVRVHLVSLSLTERDAKKQPETDHSRAIDFLG